MKKSYIIISVISLLVIVFAIISISLINDTKKDKRNEENPNNIKEQEPKEGDADMEETISIKVIINNKEMSATLINTQTTQEFLGKLPMTITMNELNDNEKYYYFNSKLSSSPESINRIYAGDIMLYQNNCLVLFYKNFTTSYKYTKIGHLDNPSELKGLITDDDLEVTFLK